MGEGCRLEDIYRYIYLYTHTHTHIYIYYYTPLPLNLANNKQQQATTSKHVTNQFWPLHLPNASGLTLVELSSLHAPTTINLPCS